MGDSKSCIDLIFTDQPNLIIESGVHPSLHERRHHQIIYGTLSVSNIALPPYTRKVWYYDKEDFVAIRRSIEMFRWHENLDKISCPIEQVKFLNEVLLNIRKVWYYDKEDFVAIRRSIEIFRWHENLDKISCPIEQVKFLNEVLLNIYSDFIPNKVKTIRPCQAPWITQTIKNFLRKKNRAYESFVRRGQPDEGLKEYKK